MPTLTKNLFWGQGETDHALDVIEGTWPTDVAGSVFIVGPDKRRPDGHWFHGQGLLGRIRLVPDASGRIEVRHRRLRTPMDRVHRRLPFLFKRIEVIELSPFGVTNLANTSLIAIDDRLFVGYDAGRPVEVDPETLEYLTPVGTTDEWFQSAPGLLEPLISVAAHSAADEAEQTLYFVNYSQVSPPGEAAETYVARWSLDGPVDRWRLTGMSAFDSIHDVKVTEHHVVFSDLPFVFEPQTLAGKPRKIRNQTHANIWIVAKANLRSTAPGGEVPVREVRLPMPAGHITVDHAEVDGAIRIVVQHAVMADLMITMKRDSVDHRTGALIDPNYEGLIAVGAQPSMVGRYVIDVATATVVESDTAVDADRVWGGLLATTDVYSAAGQRRQRTIWWSGIGFDPDLVPQEWWDLYGDATDGVVAPADLPDGPIPGSIARIDLESMKVAEVFEYEHGAFPSPPTFVPRVGATEPDDGYLVVVVHQDGPKEIQVFDAMDLERGPIARASAPTFNPNLLLHSTWTPDRRGPRQSNYRVSVWRDVLGALRGLPGVMRFLGRVGPRMAKTPTS